MPTLDLIIPTYRCNVSILSNILNLAPPSNTETRFIVVFDYPNHPNIEVFKTRFSTRNDVIFICHTKNSGASVARNRGLDKSNAEWCLFLDDDVIPDPDLLSEYERAMSANPDVLGPVGTVLFPSTSSTFTWGIILSNTNSFFSIACFLPQDVPWGCTANLLVKNNDNIRFDEHFTHTGGGEDIDYIMRKRRHHLGQDTGGFVGVPNAVVTHPWWNEGKRCYGHFISWSRSDGHIFDIYSEYTYRSVPNAVEMALMSIVLVMLGQFQQFISFLIILFTVDLIMDIFIHCFMGNRRAPSLHGLYRLICIAEANVIKHVLDFGRLWGHISRRNMKCIGLRFDWYIGRLGRDWIATEKRIDLVRMASCFCVFLTLG